LYWFGISWASSIIDYEYILYGI